MNLLAHFSIFIAEIYEIPWKYDFSFKLFMFLSEIRTIFGRKMALARPKIFQKKFKNIENVEECTYLVILTKNAK